MERKEDVPQPKEILIGQPAFRVLEVLAQVDPDIREFCFAQYDEENEGEESFFHLSPKESLSGGLEGIMTNAADQGFVVGLCSPVSLESASSTTHLKHLLMFDIDLPPSPENIDIAVQRIKQDLGVKSGFLIVSSEQGMHFLGGNLYEEDELPQLYGQSLLMKGSRGENLVDSRNVGHILESRKYVATLRISGRKGQKDIPKIIGII
jgi:hypothetical protein